MYQISKFTFIFGNTPIESNLPMPSNTHIYIYIYIYIYINSHPGVDKISGFRKQTLQKWEDYFDILSISGWLYRVVPPSYTLVHSPIYRSYI